MAKRSAGLTAFFVAALQLSAMAAMFLAVTSDGQSYHHLFDPRARKDARCHVPQTSNCNSSMFPILDFKVGFWFYHTLFKSCRPLYLGNGGLECVANQNLPLTRDECEKVCGDACGENGRVGVCAFDEHCLPEERIVTTQPRPCIAYGVKCCDRPGPNGPTVKSAATVRVPLRPVHHNSIADDHRRREPSVTIVH